MITAIDTSVLIYWPGRAPKASSSSAMSWPPTSLEAARLAGGIFKTYRRQGGPREHLVPDFLIGAHAQRQPIASPRSTAVSYHGISLASKFFGYASC
jgi:hypothetical protein